MLRKWRNVASVIKTKQSFKVRGQQIVRVYQINKHIGQPWKNN